MQYGFYTDEIIYFADYPGYKCNQHGYRTHEFNSWDNHTFVLGDSNVFGIDVKEDHKIFCNKIENKTGQKIYNLGQPGASCEEIVRILYSFTNKPSPKKVVVVWPFLLRRNHQSHDHVAPIRITGSKEPLYVKYIVNNDDDMDISHFLQQVFFVEQWCKWKNTQCYHFLHSTEDRQNLETRKVQFDNLYTYTFEDCAKDVGHIGDGHFDSVAHEAYADYVVKILDF